MNFNTERYAQMQYRKCGNSGLKLPAISLGLWHNFGDVDVYDVFRETLITAFDNGITHFDLANNYGPPPGSAENNFGKILHKDFVDHRDELIISTKAGYTMWPGPYGDWGSKKYLVASLDQSLKRMGLDYVDIFYHHRPDPNTPIEETMTVLDLIVRQGKALYVGLSNYGPLEAAVAFEYLKKLGTPCVIHQPKYSMFVRKPEDGLLNVLQEFGVGCIAFSPLAQGLLTNKYLNGIPSDSRAAKGIFLKEENITQDILDKIKMLNNIAENRNQTLAQMSIAWLLKDERVTSILVGARNKMQLLDSLHSLIHLEFDKEELEAIETILSK
ncbi:aldo/keto reductase [Rhizosphaericola mali]|uniref:L-glyceraldehyde 3-phosphate reductase n=1 Tax=Rhizosphaericola mali TaxID=2545455 RepID=A0A5P2G0P4_9BACT|nr:aldo/keto reductase [Rhizosphaericola mali]QES87390.1 L-glyceraldehyde 3-phosphate reductase [Rhizosphaericola mali]